MVTPDFVTEPTVTRKTPYFIGVFRQFVTVCNRVTRSAYVLAGGAMQNQIQKSPTTILHFRSIKRFYGYMVTMVTVL